MLIEWKKEQDFVKEALGNEYQDYNLMMAGPIGFPIEASTMQTMFNRLIEKHGLEAYFVSKTFRYRFRIRSSASSTSILPSLKHHSKTQPFTMVQMSLLSS